MYTVSVNNGVDESQVKSRKQIKKLLEEELENVGVFFSTPKRVNEPQRVSLKATAGVSLAIAEDAYENLDKDMKTIFDAARILRASVMKHGKWTFSGSLKEVNMEEVIPKQVYHFFKWCIHGHVEMKCENKKDNQTSKKAQRLSQMLIYEMISPRQASTGIDKKFQHRRDMPLQVAVGLTVHSETRSKCMIQFLHSLGISIEYGKVLRIETQIASEVIKCMEANGGIYIPRDLVEGRFIFCAADNIDFQEDTPYGKNTLHGTVMAVYQVESESDTHESIVLSKPISRRSLETIPKYLTELSHCSISSSQKVSVPTIQPMVDYRNRNQEVMDCSKLEDFVWMTASVSSITRCSKITTKLDDNIDVENENNDQDGNASSGVFVPTWSAYQSCVNKPMNTVRVCVLPLIDSSPTTASTQMTCMERLERVTTAIVGPDSKTVVTFDLGLYKPVCHLAMAKPDLSKNWVLRPGELHTVMAMLRAIGAFVEGTGLDCALTDLYGDAVLSQILAGKHVRRGIEAHTTLLLALYKCYTDVFFTHHKVIKDELDIEIKQLISVLQTVNVTEIKSVHNQTVTAVNKLKILSKMEEFDNAKGEHNPTFKVARQYMEMVENMLSYIRSVRTGNWELHLASLENFVKYFFALDLRNYASMIAWYLSNMRQIEKTNPHLWSEFMKGKWVVNKSKVPFCALGADEALEHQNRALKVTGGLVNITQKKSALARFFLIAPEVSRLAKEAKDLIGMTEYAHLHHHQLTASKSNRQMCDVTTVFNAVVNSTDPMTYDGNDLINISTKAVFSEDIKNDATRMSALGKELYASFKTERIESDHTYFWARIKQVKLKLCKTALKKVHTKVGDTIVQLKADRSLFTRLLVVARSRPDINLKESLGTYEFSAVPRSMFALDGTQLMCANKSKLMKILEDQVTNTDEMGEDITDTLQPITNQTPVTANHSSEVNSTKKMTVAVLDGMAKVQALKKPPSVKTCSDLANEFTKNLETTLSRYDEVHLVFDTYRDNSLKYSMRKKRTGNTLPVQYKICDTTYIGNTSMKLLLSHTKTKDELTAYLSEKAIQYATQRNKCLFVSWRESAKSSMDILTDELKSDQEEADTKIILHSIFACRRGATQLHIYSPDTDVFVLALWWSKLFPPDTMFITGVGQNHRIIKLSKVTDSLGPKKTSALLGLHALSGSDTTGTLSKKAKSSFWKVFNKADDDILEAVSKLGSLENFLETDRLLIEKFICQVYYPGTNISNIGDLRWWMFTKKDYQGENLPPTRASLTPYVDRVRYQTIEWCCADQPFPNLPSPLHFGWELKEDSNQYAPVMCLLPCAPETVLQLIRCSCVKRKCAPPCKCHSHNLKCTELCLCGGDEEMCDNHGDYTNNEDSLEDIDDDDRLF
jgi:hypothetical protein